MLKAIKWYKDLATGKGRLEAGAFLIEGERAIRQIISSNPDSIIEILSTAEAPSFCSSYPLRLITEKQLNVICSTRTPQGIAAVVRLPAGVYSASLPQETGSRILLLEDIQDPGNVGTLIRSAAAFDFSGVILTDKCADPFSPKCLQSTAGTVLSLWLRRTSQYLEMARQLKQNGYSLTATDLDGAEDTSVLRRHSRLILALGNEASGLSSALLQMSSHRLRLPVVSNKAESLNVAACGAICMYLSCCKNTA